MADGTIWEWTHRLLASAVAPLVIALVVVAWRNRKRSAFIAPTLGVIVALFLAQVLLGAETVRLANTPISVVLHWATAMALIAALSAMAVFAAASECTTATASRTSLRSMPALPIVLGLTAIVAFITMCVGAYVSSSGAGLACLSIPGCAGNVVVYSAGQFVQMLHRIAAAATLICAAAALAAGVGAARIASRARVGRRRVRAGCAANTARAAQRRAAIADGASRSARGQRGASSFSRSSSPRSLPRSTCIRSASHDR